MPTTQYWKPGEARPRGGDGDGDKPGDAAVRSDGSGRRDSSSRGGSTGKKRDRKRGEHAERRYSDGGASESGSAHKRERKGKKKEKGAHISRGGLRAVPKPAVVAPSKGLLMMKFMQRSVKADEALAQQQAERDKREREFSSSYAKRLKSNKFVKDPLICREDEQDPALIYVGRRSFGGFNIAAEEAYNKCVREIEAGHRLGQLRKGPRGGGDGDGISDTEMAETLAGNVRRGGRI